MRILILLLCAALLALRAVRALPMELRYIAVSGSSFNSAESIAAKDCVRRFCAKYAPGAVSAVVEPVQRRTVIRHLGPASPSSNFRATRPRYSITLRDEYGNKIDELKGINFEKPPGAPHVINALSHPVHFDPIQKAAAPPATGPVVPTACLPCRQRKKKCDGATPVCGRCADRARFGIASDSLGPCVYAPPEHGRGKRQRVDSAGGGPSHAGAESAPREHDHGAHPSQHAHTAPQPQRLYDLPLRQLDGQVHVPAASARHAPEEPAYAAAASGSSRLYDLPLRMLNGDMR